MKIFVGSTNPVKINAVITAASETYPEVVVKGFATESGVSEQPRGDEETKQGAINRAKGALEQGLPHLSGSAKQNLSSSPLNGEEEKYLGVGLEGGVFASGDELWSTVWVAVIDQKENIFTANGARCQVPEPIASLIKNGEEMGPAVDSLITGESVRQKEGMIGVITKGFVDRTEEYSAIAKFALGLWYGRHWHDTLSK